MMTEIGLGIIQMKYWVATAVFLLGTSAAYAMDADTFYIKGLALQKKGMAAMFSSDLKVVISELNAASTAVKAENEAAKASGNPIYCAPAKPQKMSPDQLLGEFAKIPAARRKTQTVKSAWREIVMRKYPC
jgi:hypothetical protein